MFSAWKEAPEGFDIVQIVYVRSRSCLGVWDPKGGSATPHTVFGFAAFYWSPRSFKRGARRETISAHRDCLVSQREILQINLKIHYGPLCSWFKHFAPRGIHPTGLATCMRLAKMFLCAPPYVKNLGLHCIAQCSTNSTNPIVFFVIKTGACPDLTRARSPPPSSQL